MIIVCIQHNEDDNPYIDIVFDTEEDDFTYITKYTIFDGYFMVIKKQHTSLFMYIENNWL